VVDLPVIRRLELDPDGAILEGKDLDVTIGQVFRSEDDVEGGELSRQSDGTYRISLPSLQRDSLWIELTDAPGRRFRLSSVELPDDGDKKL
jgi:hypothetical protein